jgi:hypothetical protein
MAPFIPNAWSYFSPQETVVSLRIKDKAGVNPHDLFLFFFWQ